MWIVLAQYGGLHREVSSVDLFTCQMLSERHSQLTASSRSMRVTMSVQHTGRQCAAAPLVHVGFIRQRAGRGSVHDEYEPARRGEDEADGSWCESQFRHGSEKERQPAEARSDASERSWRARNRQLSWTSNSSRSLSSPR